MPPDIISTGDQSEHVEMPTTTWLLVENPGRAKARADEEAKVDEAKGKARVDKEAKVDEAKGEGERDEEAKLDGAKGDEETME